MPNGDPKHDSIVDILISHGFALENIQVDTDPPLELFIKPRPGSPFVVTVPMDCTGLPDESLKTMMLTAQVPEPEYRHLLNRP